jgi:hypothetical protein
VMKLLPERRWCPCPRRRVGAALVTQRSNNNPQEQEK